MAHFLVNGLEIPVAGNLTLGEARTIKRISGTTITGLDEGLTSLDPDVLAALVLVSWRRVDPTVTEAAVDDLDLEALVSEAGVPEEEAESPPAEAPAEAPPAAVEAPSGGSDAPTA